MKKYENIKAEIIYLTPSDCLTISSRGYYEGEELPDAIIRLNPWSNL